MKRLVETSDLPNRLPAQSPMPRRLAIAIVLLLALVAVPETSATITGPCSASIAGQDVAGRDTGALSDAIPVSKERPVSVTMSSGRPITHLKVEIEYAGLRWAVQDRPSSGNSWASEVRVDDYAIYGLGLYKIVGTSTGAGFSCEGAALVTVEGDNALDPLATIAGIAGLGLALLGTFGILAIASRVARGRGAPFLGLLFGVILGVGIAVLLQQFSVLYPTVGVTGALLTLGAAVGLAFSLFGLPTRSSDARN